MKVIISDDDELAPTMEFSLSQVLVMRRGEQVIGLFENKEEIMATWPDRKVTITDE